MPDLPQDDPLAQVFVTEEKTVDTRLLAETILPFVRIYEGGGKLEIGFTDEGQQITVREKLLVYLLGRKAIALKYPDRLPREGMTPKELEENTEIPGGTIRPILKKLLEERLVLQDKSADAAYYVPNRAIKRVNELVNKKG